MKLFKIDTIQEVKEKLDFYFGQASGSCGESGGTEELPLFQAMNRYLAEEIAVEENLSFGRKGYDKGHRITAKEIGVLAALGHSTVQVYIQPIISIITAGEEVVSIFEEPGPKQVRDINSYLLMALLEKTGAKVGGISLVRNVHDELKKTMKDALDRSDMVIICGKITEDKKTISSIINSLGEPGVITRAIAMEPVKECIIGVMKDEHCCCCSRSKLAVGISGNPMEAILSYQTIIDYFIKKYYFKSVDAEKAITAKIAKNISSKKGKETFCFITLKQEGSDWIAEPIDTTLSGVEQLFTADGYVNLRDTSIETGESVKVFQL
ncbi:molybdopterin-binding protein [Clostridium aminobutyricum]|uniref:Molybdopterin molybdenumtransferase n=1 Tax=Clostridium aminobutyricum TaxID=33953 RepID=A0A939D8Q8_CLOAM|nr:molybdopterin-binding protein [Clostridium aminobutyricum]MBN7773211.1 hypothetical protein [Clostridium aminobutyricum]